MELEPHHRRTTPRLSHHRLPHPFSDYHLRLRARLGVVPAAELFGIHRGEEEKEEEEERRHIGFFGAEEMKIVLVLKIHECK